MLAQFEEDGLIEMPNGGKQAKYFYLYYIDDNPEEIAVVVEDFFDFYLYYEQYVKGGRLIRCSECGKLVLVKETNSPMKYCKKCAREKIDEHNRNRKK
jgi:DNA-directed RNA polymerase subunit RPC12/RpoP